MKKSKFRLTRLLFFITLSLLLALFQSMVYAQDEVNDFIKQVQKSSHSYISDWKYNTNDITNGANPKLDETGWKTISNISSRGTTRFYSKDSFCWFRKTIVIPETIWATKVDGKEVSFLVNVGARAEFYVNGKQIKSLKDAEKNSRGNVQKIILTENARPGQKFLIAIRAHSDGDWIWFVDDRLDLDKTGTLSERINEFTQEIYLADKILGKKANQLRNNLQNVLRKVDLEAMSNGDTQRFVSSLTVSKDDFDSFADLVAKTNLRKFYMIGHAHIDPVWRWTKDEGYQEVFATFRSALDRMNEFPDVAFISSSAQFYEWVEKSDPVMFAEIKQRVKEGRWNIVGGWWIEPDINCPSGESLVRQGLYGQRFFKEKFGCKARIGFNPDSFGHPWTLPQILKLQGMNSYFFMRPGIHEKRELPAPIFRWKGPDDSEILTVQIISSYNGDASSIEGKMVNYVKRFDRDLPGVQDYALFYGIGNHGGGPTIATINRINEISQQKYFSMQFETLDNYIDLIRPMADNFPIVNDELQHHARGCYSACADIKMWNRQAESALIQAEKISSFTSILCENSYSKDEFRDSWKKVLFNQFHDILAGSSIEQGYVDAEQEYGYAMTVARENTTESLHHLTQSIETNDEAYDRSTPFIVFNPCSWSVKRPIEISMQGGGMPVLRDAGGKQVPFQKIRTAGVRVGGRGRYVFQAEVPSLGYQLYRLDFSGKEKRIIKTGVKVDKLTLENDWVRISFDSSTGYISSYFDKKINRELLSKPAAVPVVLNDWDDTWGHRIVAYDQELGRFGNANLMVMEEGPERGRIQVKSTYGNSFIIQDFALHRGSPELECKVTVNWHEHYRVLKIGFPTSLNKGKLTYSIPYGFIEREMNGEEEPGQTWIDISGSDSKGAFGIALFNDSKCGYSVKDGEIRLTIFHSTAWSDHEQDVFDETDGYRFMEQGIHEFSYCFVPHEGDWRQGDIARKAEEYLTPPVSLLTTNHIGKLAKQDSFAAVSAPNVSITVVKMAEDDDALVLRCVELHGKETKTMMEIKSLGRTIDFTMKPCEIKTFLVPLDEKKPVKIVNVIEE